jgi:hypothetical protein
VPNATPERPGVAAPEVVPLGLGCRRAGQPFCGAMCLGGYIGANESLRSWAVVYDGRSVTVLRGDLQPTRS